MKNILKKSIFVFILVVIFGTGANVSLASTAPTIVSGTATNITTTSADLNGVVNPNGDTTTAWFETTTGGPFQSQNLGNGNSNVPMLAYSLTGLTPSTTYTFKVVAGNSNGPIDSGFIFSFTTAAAPAPTIISATATGITTTSAILNGVVNPNGDNTTAWFETPSGGPTPSQNLGSGNSGITMLTYSLTGLTPSTSYTFRVVTGNNNGGPNIGGWVSFTTATPPALPTPTLVSTTTSNITTTSVDLNGIVNPNGYATTAWFETPSGGPFQNQNLGSGNSNVPMLAYSLTGLTPSTTYTFRIITGNTNGSITGGWISFTTATPPAQPAPTIVSGTATNITTTSADLNGVVNPNGYATTAWFETPSGGPFQNQNLNNGSINVTMLPYSLTGLTPSTTYTFRVIAGNTNGSTTGGWISFTTAAIIGGGGGGGGGGGTIYLPLVTTQNATAISNNSVTLNASINPSGYATTAWFEYGTVSNLITSNSTTHNTEGSGNTASTLGQNTVNLIPNTTYYFRAVANNTYGTIRGSILSFQTTTIPVVVTPVVTPTVVTTTPNKITAVANTKTPKTNNQDGKVKIIDSMEGVSVGDEINTAPEAPVTTDPSLQKDTVPKPVATDTGLEANSIFGLTSLPHLIGWIVLIFIILILVIIGRKKYKKTDKEA